MSYKMVSGQVISRVAVRNFRSTLRSSYIWHAICLGLDEYYFKFNINY